MRRGWMLAGVVILAAVPAVPVAASGVSLVLERVDAVQDGVGKWIRTGDTQRFRVRVNGMSLGGGRVAVAASPVAALSVSCGSLPITESDALAPAPAPGAGWLADRALTLAGVSERDDAAVVPGARVCRLGNAAEARSVDVTVTAPEGVGEVVVAAVAKVRPEADGSAAEMLEKTVIAPVVNADGSGVEAPAVEGAAPGVADEGRRSLSVPAGSDQVAVAAATSRCAPADRCPSLGPDQPAQPNDELATGNAVPGRPSGEQSLLPGGEQTVSSGAEQPVQPVVGRQTAQTRHARQAWRNGRVRQARQVGHGQQVSTETAALPQAQAGSPALGIPPAQAVPPAQGVPSAQAVPPAGAVSQVRTAPQKHTGARGRAVHSAQTAPGAPAVPSVQAAPTVQAATPVQAVPPVQVPGAQGVGGLGGAQQVQGGQVPQGSGQTLSGLRLPEVAGGDAMLDVPPGVAGEPPEDGPFVPPAGGGGLAAPLPIEVRMAHDRPQPVAAVANPLKGSFGHVLAVTAVATLLAGLWGIVTVQRRSKRKILR
ncbi:hypothetical protein [Nonomuraea wenchangensis]|uniref:hypothetical protein n=1 Tax=Nonomuraea wenchangensis TaxID=568860 RepID=UPI003320137F